MTLKTCIIDDDEIFREHLALELKKFSQIELIGSFSSAIDALPLLHEGQVQLLFLDIDMPDINGLAFKKQLPSNLPTVFVTSHSSYAVQGFEVNAFDFIPKPVTSERLLNTIQRAIAFYQPTHRLEQNEFVYLNIDNKYIKLFLKDIIAAEADENYTKVHTKGNSYISLIRLRRLEEQLPANSFLRVHRSFIINPLHIQEIDGNVLIMEGDIKVPISAALREQVIKSTVKSRLLKR